MIKEFQGQYRWLSNFWPSPFVLDGIHFPTVEHGYQAYKASDGQEFVRILDARSPGEAKRLGKRVKLRMNWEAIKDGVMLALVRAKFEQNPDLAAKLIATGDEELVEGNTWGDTYWGVCRGVGQNKLGKILMNVRQELAALPEGEG